MSFFKNIIHFYRARYFKVEMKQFTFSKKKKHLAIPQHVASHGYFALLASDVI